MQGGIYILNRMDPESGVVDFIGKWRKGLPLNIKIYVRGDSITVMKNDIKSFELSRCFNCSRLREIILFLFYKLSLTNRIRMLNT